MVRRRERDAARARAPPPRAPIQVAVASRAQVARHLEVRPRWQVECQCLPTGRCGLPGRRMRSVHPRVQQLREAMPRDQAPGTQTRVGRARGEADPDRRPQLFVQASTRQDLQPAVRRVGRAQGADPRRRPQVLRQDLRPVVRGAGAGPRVAQAHVQVLRAGAGGRARARARARDWVHARARVRVGRVAVGGVQMRRL